MCKPILSVLSAKLLSHTKNLLFISFTCVLFFALLLFTIPAQGVSTHGCAPDTPPTVPGTPVVPQARAGIIRINETLSNPASVWNCSDTTRSFTPTGDSWVELYNPQSEPLNLYPTHTQISLDNGANWYQLPFGTSIAANGFLVLFPEEKVPTPSTWNIILAMGSTQIDAIQPPALQADQSYARVPDGSNTWSLSSQPTIGTSNVSSFPPTPPTVPKNTPTGQPALPGNSPGGGGANSPISVGTQPAWGSVQLPAGATPSPAPGATDTTAPPPPLLVQQPPGRPQNSGLDGWHIAGICTLALLLLGSSIYCWRLFHMP